MKKIWRMLCLSFFIGLFLCGCTHDMNREEIDEIDMVLVFGIDYKAGEYQVCALYSTGGGADSEAGAGSGTEELAKGKGKTVYEALEDLKLKNKKNITLAQTGTFLIGDGAARQGVDQSIDFLKRDETIKMEALIYVIKDSDAEEFIKNGMKNKQTIHTDLEALKQKQLKLVTRNENTMVNILNDMEQEYSCVLLPYLIAEKKSFLIDGYAVFDHLKLKDYLDHDTSDGVNFIRNIIRSFPIYLKDGVGLSIAYTKTRMKAEVKDQVITIIVKVDFETMFKEITTDVKVFTNDELQRLTQEQNEYVQSILKKPVEYSIKNGLDVLRIARLVENQNVTEWRNIEGKWPDIIANINYQYRVRSKITKSFILGRQ